MLSKALHSLWSASLRSLIPPPTKPTDEQQRLYDTVIKAKDECVYCGDVATSMDHFRALMKPRGAPSGFCDDIWNLVPCCLICNSSKGNRPWRVFMMRKNGKAPLARGIPIAAHRKRVAKLEMFEQTGSKYLQRWNAKKYASKLSALRTTVVESVRLHAGRITRLQKFIQVAPTARRATRFKHFRK